MEVVTLVHTYHNPLSSLVAITIKFKNIYIYIFSKCWMILKKKIKQEIKYKRVPSFFYVLLYSSKFYNEKILISYFLFLFFFYKKLFFRLGLESHTTWSSFIPLCAWIPHFDWWMCFKNELKSQLKLKRKKQKIEKIKKILHEAFCVCEWIWKVISPIRHIVEDMRLLDSRFTKFHLIFSFLN